MPREVINLSWFDSKMKTSSCGASVLRKVTISFANARVCCKNANPWDDVFMRIFSVLGLFKITC